MKLKFLFLFVLFQSLNAYACLYAKQHKLFPIAVLDGNIIMIEAHIHRTEDINKDDKERHMMKVKWKIKSYISIYDTSQNLISKTEMEKVEIKGDSYEPILQSVYTKGLFQIKSIYSDLDYFEAEYISFCDYRKKCKKLEVKTDTLAKTDTFKYKKKNFTIQLEDNKKDKENALFTDNLSHYYLSSVRIYKAKAIELVLGHLATGHEVSMGYITENPDEKETEDGYKYEAREEYKPDFNLDDLYTAVYQEPIMHHGYGFDLFIVTEN